MFDNLIVRISGVCFILVALYFIGFKQIIMPIIGVTKPAVVVGFKPKRSHSMTHERNSSKLLVNARTAYARFVPTGAADSITVLSDGDPIFGLLNYHRYDRVTVAYWSNSNPRSATIISWRNYPMYIAFAAIGFLLLFIDLTPAKK